MSLSQSQTKLKSHNEEDIDAEVHNIIESRGGS